MDAVCRSSNCLGVEKTSALAGYAVIADLIEPSRVFEGGNPTLAKALVTKLGSGTGNRCLTGTFVWSIDVSDSGVSVVYSTKDGAVHRVKAKFAIVCTPPMVTARIIHGVSDAAKASMLSFKYGSYLVANLLLKKQCFNGAYDNWVSPPYTFNDIVQADKPYQVGNSYKSDMGSVLTIYQPYEPGSIGRPQLFVGDRTEFSKSIVQQMDKLIPGLEANLEEVVLTRWGHAMEVPSVGFHKKMSALMSGVSGDYALAHCSTQGAPCAEGAVRAGKLAATKALSVGGAKSFKQFGINPIARSMESLDS
jgi:protoporphyrinogen oxidase